MRKTILITTAAILCTVAAMYLHRKFLSLRIAHEIKQRFEKLRSQGREPIVLISNLFNEIIGCHPAES